MNLFERPLAAHDFLRERQVRKTMYQCTFALLFILTTHSPLYGSEWTALKDGKNRMETTVEAQPEPASLTKVPLPQGHYAAGQGVIEGAFGISFGEPINQNLVNERLGWQTIERLPNGLKYRGLVTPLTIERVSLLPPNQPPLLKAQNIRYFALLDFEQNVLRLETGPIDRPDATIGIISRKYGQPDLVDGATSTFIRGDRQLQIVQRKTGQPATLIYEDINRFTTYMAERNRSLKRKFRNNENERLSPNEKQIVALAEQLVEFRQGGGAAFGLPFGRRVGFRAEPDEFIDFQAPEPLSGVKDGEYRIMVSPDLMPVAVRYQKQGSPEALAETKKMIELSMELAFAGFLKQTERHSVVSFDQNAYSLLIRKGAFSFTVHNRAENNRRIERAADAKAERQRLAELERQRQEIAARQKQIKEENAF